MQAVLVVNPFASRVTETRLARGRGASSRASSSSTVVRTEQPRHATELVSEACRDGCDAVDRLLRRRRLQRGAERARGRRADRLPARRRHERAAARARAAGRARRRGAAGSPTRSSRAARAGSRSAASTAAASRSAPGVGLDAEAVRARRRDGPRDDGKRPGDLAFALAVVARRSPRSRGHVEPVLEVKGIGRAACAFVANGAPVHVREAARAADRARGRLRARPRLRRAGPRPPALARADGVRGAARPSARRRTCSTRTTSTGSRSSATSRCRCRSTARISATSRAPSSRPSGAPSTSSSSPDWTNPCWTDSSRHADRAATSVSS